MTRWVSFPSAMVVALVLTTPATAFQDPQKDAKPAPKTDAKGEAREKPTTNKDRVDGTVESIDKAKNILLVRTRPDGNLRQVVLSSETAYSVQNKPAAIDDLRSGRRVICTGQLNQKDQLLAIRCEVRQPK